MREGAGRVVKPEGGEGRGGIEINGDISLNIEIRHIYLHSPSPSPQVDNPVEFLQLLF